METANLWKYTILFIIGYLFLVIPTVKKMEKPEMKKTARITGTGAVLGVLIIMYMLNTNYMFIKSIIIFLVLRMIYSKSIKNNNLKKTINMPHENLMTSTSSNSIKVMVSTTELTCPSCGNVCQPNTKYCNKCGTMLPVATKTIMQKHTGYVAPTDFDPENTFSLYEFIKKRVIKELNKAEIDPKGKYIPNSVLKTRNILSTIFALLLSFYITLIFFHFPDITYMIGLIILVFMFILTINFNFVNYVTKQIRTRPSEKISNVVMSLKPTLVKNTSKIYLALITLIAIAIPLIVFKEPKILYEKMDDGYGVRFYAYGWNNKTIANIPENYKGEKVIALRGNTFSNMKNLAEINLPDTIIEIRGQAFAGLEKLTKIRLPENLEYLGGSAFEGCTSLEEIEIPYKVKEINGDTFNGDYSLRKVILNEGLKRIGGNAFNGCSIEEITIPSTVTEIGGNAFHNNGELKTVKLSEGLETIEGGAFAGCEELLEIIIPDTVTSIGGEAFKYDYNLKTVKLSNNIIEIKGNTFESCTSLSEITIPDKVTRIGGHAFYGTGLSKVTFTKNSKLEEIGSSAFRNCKYLKSIKLPKGIRVNERSFKESPTAISYFN